MGRARYIAIGLALAAATSATAQVGSLEVFWSPICIEPHWEWAKSKVLGDPARLKSDYELYARCLKAQADAGAREASRLVYAKAKEELDRVEAGGRREGFTFR